MTSTHASETSTFSLLLIFFIEGVGLGAMDAADGRCGIEVTWLSHGHPAEPVTCGSCTMAALQHYKSC